ncbi:MAG: hypothetical protein SNJ70_01470 [Armatimonadota bacterium]
MKRIILMSIIVLMLIFCVIITIGCGGSTVPAPRLGSVEQLSVPETFSESEITSHRSVAPSISSGVEPRGQVGTITRYRNEMEDFTNPNFVNGYLTPSTFKVAVTKIELLKGVNDSNPYVVFDIEDLSNANVFDLSSSTINAIQGNTSYPSAGTYTHIRMKIVYVELGIRADLFDEGISNYLMRLYCSSVPPVLNGDVLIYMNNTWNWMFDDLEDNDLSLDDILLPLAGGRPDNNSGWLFHEFGYPDKLSCVVQDYFFSMDENIVEESIDPYVETFELPKPIVFPSNPSGVYIVAFKFDKTNIFVFDDVDGNGVFEPMGGDDVTEEMLGEPIWYIEAPDVDVAIIKYQN